MSENDSLTHKELNDGGNIGRNHVCWQFKYGDTGILTGWIVSHVSEIKIAGQQTQLLRLRERADDVVGCRSQPNIAHICRLMAKVANCHSGRSWHVGVNQKVHTVSRGWQQVILFFVDSFGRESQGGRNVIRH